MFWFNDRYLGPMPWKFLVYCSFKIYSVLMRNDLELNWIELNWTTNLWKSPLWRSVDRLNSTGQMTPLYWIRSNLVLVSKYMDLIPTKPPARPMDLDASRLCWRLLCVVGPLIPADSACLACGHIVPTQPGRTRRCTRPHHCCRIRD